jgi:hypothetical protein
MRIKHALAVPRPVEFSPQIMPMIQTPRSRHFSGRPRRRVVHGGNRLVRSDGSGK